MSRIKLKSASTATKAAVAVFAVLAATGATYGAVQAIAAVVVPTPVIGAKPANPTADKSATFKFTDSLRGVTFQCSLDGAAFANCSSGKTYSGLSEITHGFRVRARTSAGALSAVASYTWRVDRTPPPAPTITGKPTNPSNVTAPVFTFTDAEAGALFQCSLDGSNFKACTSPQNYTGQSMGNHTFRVKAADVVGNLSAATAYTWKIDRTAPNAPVIDTKPTNPSALPTATFTFHSNQANITLQCRLDAAVMAACTSPKTYSGLTPTSHTFAVMAVDAAGNVSPAVMYTWVVQSPVTGFSLAGNVTQPLYPGATAPVDVKITNPFTYPIQVSGITVAPKAATTRNGQPNPGCDGTVNLAFLHQYTGASIRVNAGQTVSLSGLGLAQSLWPLLTMPNLPVNQNACQSTSFTFNYSATGTEVTP